MAFLLYIALLWVIWYIIPLYFILSSDFAHVCIIKVYIFFIFAKYKARIKYLRIRDGQRIKRVAGSTSGFVGSRRSRMLYHVCLYPDGCVQVQQVRCGCNCAAECAVRAAADVLETWVKGCVCGRRTPLRRLSCRIPSVAGGPSRW